MTTTPYRLLAALILLVMTASCALLDPLGHARGLALSAGFREITLDAPPFALFGFLKSRPQAGDLLVVYIEGDGFAWRSRTTPSSDPTPRDPVSLRLAVADPSPHVLYLARPCQYRPENRTCHPKYWTSARYAPEVVAAMAQAVETTRQQVGAQKVGLVGYSGGGTLAALVAARQPRTAFLVTVAANLAVGFWARHHGVTPLSDSLDPADFGAALAPVPQYHFVGGEDAVCPLDILERFLQTLPHPSAIRWRRVPGFDHACCWADAWKTLMAETSFWRPAHDQTSDFSTPSPGPVAVAPGAGGG